MRLLALPLLFVLAAPVLAQDAPGYRSEATGFQFMFPDRWDGPSAVDEEGLPGRAVYRFEATNRDHAGAVLIVERVMGLNPLLEERFRRGQVSFGYHGFQPTAALSDEAMIFGPGAGFEIVAGDRTGRAYFLQRGRALWAIHMAAPPEALSAVPDLFDTLARRVRVSEDDPPTASASR